MDRDRDVAVSHSASGVSSAVGRTELFSKLFC